MPAQILPFPSQPPSLSSPIAGYLRTGDDHGRPAVLHAALRRMHEHRGGEWIRSRLIACRLPAGPPLPVGTATKARTGAVRRHVDDSNEQGGLSGTGIADIAAVLKILDRLDAEVDL